MNNLCLSQRPPIKPTGRQASKTGPAPTQVPIEMLLVDDDNTVASLIEEYLGTMNFTIKRASNGEEALKLLELRDYDVILSDIKMPVMDGINFFDRLSGRAAKHRDRFIFMTAAPDRRVETFLQRCSRPVILKPFAFSELIREVDTIIGPREGS